ncbi:hypothetical protein [Nocardioides sp. Soil805]|uniref:hypothetical protein n=1 Tax=Nocardioides sp. Soil805 TaxID=1736416 RepID=UPI0012E3F1FF|nr:hypothetical protein [Nocardioides sp. Soil805]
MSFTHSNRPSTPCRVSLIPHICSHNLQALSVTLTQSLTIPLTVSLTTSPTRSKPGIRDAIRVPRYWLRTLTTGQRSMMAAPRTDTACRDGRADELSDPFSVALLLPHPSTNDHG